MKKTPKTFCTKCGREKTNKVMFKSFDEKTGKQRFSMECPDENALDCIHNHDYQKPKGFFKAGQKCTKCGDEYYFMYY